MIANFKSYCTNTGKHQVIFAGICDPLPPPGRNNNRIANFNFLVNIGFQFYKTFPLNNYVPFSCIFQIVPFGGDSFFIPCPGNTY